MSWNGRPPCTGHGVPVPAAHDGEPWHAVAPGESRRYRYAFPKGSAGLHWFHPHPHGGTAHGLAGALRLRLINVCAGRYLRLDEHERTLIGTDGGLIERPQALPELLLTPGERADLLVRISDQAEASFQLASHPYERDWMGARPAHLDAVAPLLTIHTHEAEVVPAVTLPARLARIDPLGEPAVRRTIDLTEVMLGMEHDAGEADSGGTMDHGGHGNQGQPDAHAGHGAPADHGEGHNGAMAGDDARPEVGFLINGRSFVMGEVMFEGKAGEVEEWEVFNDSHMDHPAISSSTRSWG